MRVLSARGSVSGGGGQCLNEKYDDMMKNIGNLFVRLFVVSLLAFRHFSTIVSLFGAGAALFFLWLRSGSEQTVSAAPAPAPAKKCRLRLRLRIPSKQC